MIKREDKRTAKRIGYICEVECEGDGLNRLATRITDLSVTGAFIDSMTCYPPGAHIRLRFHIQDVLIESTAEVRYTLPQMGMGVHFLGLEPGHLAALESLIEGKPLIRLPEPETSEPDETEERETKQNNWNTPDMLLGNFAIVSMFDVIQIVENNRLSGLLRVKSPAVNGEIQFNDGQIAGADSGSRMGVEALKGFLDVAEGSFEFRRSDAHYPATINAPNNVSLMLELLSVMDDEAAARL